MPVNLATKYSSKIDEVLAQNSLTDVAVNKDYDFVGAQTVKVYSFGTAAMNDYQASGANRYGTPSELEDSIQELTMSKKRSFTFTIDKTNAIDSPEGVRDAAKALRRQLDLAVIPEIDTYRLVKLADNAYKKEVATISNTNAYEKFLDANAAISENEMPLDGRIAFVTPNFYKLIKQDDSFVKAADISQEMLIKGQVGMVDNVAIVMCTSKRMAAGASFVITHPIACTSPVKLADYKIHQDPPGLAGNLVEGLVYYDAFILNNKNKAIAVHYGELGALTISMEATSTTNKGKITVSGNLNGGTLVYKTAANQAAPALADDLSSWTELPETGIISATATHKVVVAIRNSDKKCVATSAAIVVDVGA